MEINVDPLIERTKQYMDSEGYDYVDSEIEALLEEFLNDYFTWKGLEFAIREVVDSNFDRG